MRLIEVLQAAQPAARKLVGILQGKYPDGGNLKHLRLTCRELRRLVDDNVSELELTVRQQDHELWSTGQLPSLERWPACTGVRLRLQPVHDGGGISDNHDDGHLAVLACVPFIKLALQQRQRISRLILMWVGRTPHAAWQAEVAVLALASLLPGLQDLDLWFAGMSYQPLQQQLMFKSLASMTQLQKLTLPSGRNLEHLGPLAGRLRKLSLEMKDPDADGVSPKGAACLSQLHGLEEFDVSVMGDFDMPFPVGSLVDVAVLRLLLDHVPTSVHTFTYAYSTSSYGDVRITLEGRSDDSDSQDEQEALLLSYQVFPRWRGAVLAAFRDAEGLLDAVKAVAASLSPELKVTSAAAASSAEWGVLDALQQPSFVNPQELQSRWDAWLPGCGGNPAAEAVLLLRLLGVWEQLVREMPCEVKM
ncbi:hypothetical protein GPECTOR_18g120 [Gonium pectorale]|uniref:Uncharacterized protein n=1 Tax=Gonium pectorale TaxID=33097 RepID=A0A150GJI0_GONPE|nr:hypothetical protein GPECTOR_18g120 [Gonium pectorale]|eukprot:KXZ49963.1 hypothetical protein GPECTOR_18g120 [Gonium pectorale]